MPMEASAPIPKKEFLGEILIRRGLITEKQLEHALEIQKKEKACIGDILVKLGFVEELDVVAALVVQCNFPYIFINKYDIDRNILQMIPKEIACRHRVIPLDRVGDILSVVMVDPLDTSLKVELQRMTNCRIVPFVTTKKEMEKALERWYAE